MKSVALVASVVGLALACSSARAFGDDCCQPVCAPQVTWVEKTITCYRPVVHEKQVTVMVNRVHTQEVVTPLTRTCWVPQVQLVEKTITVQKPVCRDVVRDVVCCRMVPVCVTDPCTGCTQTVCKPQQYVQQVHTTVTDFVPVPRKVMCEVCTYKKVEETIQCRRLVCTLVPEPCTHKVCYTELVPYPVVVKVPVCVPCCR